MKTHTVIDGNAFYEIDEKCYEELMKKREDHDKRRSRNQKTGERIKRESVGEEA